MDIGDNFCDAQVQGPCFFLRWEESSTGSNGQKVRPFSTTNIATPIRHWRRGSPKEPQSTRETEKEDPKLPIDFLREREALPHQLCRCTFLTVRKKDPIHNPSYPILSIQTYPSYLYLSHTYPYLIHIGGSLFRFASRYWHILQSPSLTNHLSSDHLQRPPASASASRRPLVPQTVKTKTPERLDKIRRGIDSLNLICLFSPLHILRSVLPLCKQFQSSCPPLSQAVIRSPKPPRLSLQRIGVRGCSSID